MAAALLSIVLLVSPDSGVASIEDAVARSVHQVLDAKVTLAPRLGPLSDRELEETARRLSADAVVEVAWQRTERNAVVLHVYLDGPKRWLVHTLHFDPADADAERARAVGFSIASLLPEAAVAMTSEARSTDSLRTSPTQSHSNEATPTEASAARRFPTPAHAYRGALEGAFDGAFPLGGGSWGGLGGSLGASGRLGERVSARLGLTAHVSRIDSAHATSTEVIGKLGIRYGQSAISRPPFGWGLGADLFVMRAELVHLSDDDDVPQTQSRWIPGASLAGEAGWALGRTIEAVLGIGAEVAFGRTEIYVHNRRVTELGPVRGFVSAGVRVPF